MKTLISLLVVILIGEVITYCFLCTLKIITTTSPVTKKLLGLISTCKAKDLSNNWTFYSKTANATVFKFYDVYHICGRSINI